MWDKLPSYLTGAEDKLLVEDRRLRDSYRRCEEAHVDRNAEAPRLTLRGETLRGFLVYRAGAIAYAHLLFAETHRCLCDQTTIFILTDTEARVMELFSHPEVLDGAMRRSGIKPGVSLSEESCGTNAVALALHYREETAVRGGQHYCRLFSDWCTAATPVFGIDGRVSACVCLAASAAQGLGEKLALAKCLAKELNAFLRGGAAVEAQRAGAHARIEPGEAVPGESPAVLTERQRQVLQLFAEGLSYKQIASRLGIHSTKTVEEHLDAVRAKLGAKSRRECIQRASEIGLLNP